MLNILDQIGQWIKDFLIECIVGNLSGLFDQVNDTVGDVAAQVGQTPQGWNGSVFSMVRSLSDNVIIPIAGIILTFVLCYELISMIIDRNNMHDVDTFMFFKWFFKAWVAVYIVTHTFDITMAIFDLAQYVVRQSSGVITGNTAIPFGTVLGNLQDQLETMGRGELFGLLIESVLIRITTPILSLCVMLVLVGRMVEIYIYCSIGAIPFATMANREWGQIGNNYLHGLVALGLQGFFIMICVAIYSVLVSGIGAAGSIHAAIWRCAGYTVLLCFSLFKTSSVSRSIFNAH